MTTRRALHRLIEQLPEQEFDAVREFLESLGDPVLRGLLSAPEDDELLTAEESADLADRSVSTIPHDALMRELGL